MNELSMKRAVVGALLNRHVLISQELLENLADPVYLKWAHENFCQPDFLTIIAHKHGQVRTWNWQGKLNKRETNMEELNEKDKQTNN